MVPAKLTSAPCAALSLEALSCATPTHQGAALGCLDAADRIFLKET